MIPDESPMTLAGYMPTREEYDRVLRLLRALTAQLAAKDAEVARLTELLSEAVTGVGYAVTFGNMVSKCETIDNCGDPDAVLYLLGEAQSIEKRLRAALRGDTAPAQPDAPARLYGKYRISKADGSPTDPEAEYFVLRIDTDPAARDAVAAYADYISFSAPEFCDDLRRWLVRVPLKPAPAGAPHEGGAA